MADFTALTIVAGTSVEVQVRENIRRALAALETKVHAQLDRPLRGNLNCGGFRVRNVATQTAVSTDEACTLEALQAIAAL